MPKNGSRKETDFFLSRFHQVQTQRQSYIAVKDRNSQWLLCFTPLCWCVQCLEVGNRHRTWAYALLPSNSHSQEWPNFALGKNGWRRSTHLCISNMFKASPIKRNSGESHMLDLHVHKMFAWSWWRSGGNRKLCIPINYSECLDLVTKNDWAMLSWVLKQLSFYWKS